MTNYDRRTLLRIGGVGTFAALAGCSVGSDEETTPTDGQSPTASGDAGDGPPGADVLGGPEDLQSSATVEATSLDSDQGAGQHVFTPAVVWIEAGATVTLVDVAGGHSVTAYHPDNDRPERVPSGTAGFDSGLLETDETFEHTFDEPGVYNYYCRPHEGLGMVGLVIVEGSQDGPGTTAPEDVESSAASEALIRLLELADVGGDGDGAAEYGWVDATWDSYWYSLYNMSANISMSGNGVLFPHNEEQQRAFDERFPKMLEAAGEDQPPVKDANLNMAAFTSGDPSFTQEPVLSGEDGRPDASTLAWDPEAASGVVSPSSLGWTHLKGVTWAKNFENHFGVLPEELAAEFRSMVLATLAQIGIKATLVEGGPEGNGALTKGETLELVSGFRPADGTVVDETARPHHHAAMLWFLSDMTSLAQGGWFGYEYPEPLIPPEQIQQLTDGVAGTTMDLFAPSDVVEMRSTRDLGELLGAIAWYGTHAGDADLEARAASYANDLAAEVEANLAADGRIEAGADNQAATQGVVAQGLLWASELDGVDNAGTAEDAIGYLLEDLWDDEAGVFASGVDDSTYTITARDAADVTGGINAADALLDADVGEQYARFFDQTFNRGRLQRAERPQSRDENAEYTLPLPPEAGGEYGQAAVYNAAVEYDVDADEWSVADRTFDTEGSLYLANQDIWISHWGGDFFQGRGVPGRNDSPE